MYRPIRADKGIIQEVSPRLPYQLLLYPTCSMGDQINYRHSLRVLPNIEINGVCPRELRQLRAK